MISSKGKRFLAYILDGITLGIISGVLMFALLIPMGLASSSKSGLLAASSILLFFVFNILVVGIQIYFWSKSTSIGKKMLRMTIVDKDTGKPIGLGKMLLREIIGKYLSGLVLCFGYLLILFDSNNQGLHDKIVNSVVMENK